LGHPNTHTTLGQETRWLLSGHMTLAILMSTLSIQVSHNTSLHKLQDFGQDFRKIL